MSQPQYPVDLIAIRDEKLKMAKTVIKSWNVRFVDAINSQVVAAEEYQEDPFEAGSKEIEETHNIPESQEDLSDEQLEAIARANEIFGRLEAEKAADEAVKAAEIAAAYAAAEAAEAGQQLEEHYNATTNSYSGAYGTGPVDEDTASQAASILAEKSDAMADLINSIQAG